MSMNSFYLHGQRDALEKYAATMQQLQAAARRIGAVTPGQADRLTIKQLPALEKRFGGLEGVRKGFTSGKIDAPLALEDLGGVGDLGGRLVYPTRAQHKAELAAAVAGHRPRPAEPVFPGLAVTPKGPNSVMSSLQASFDRGANPKNLKRTPGGAKPEALFHENNLIAGARGPQAEGAAKRLMDRRDASGESLAVEDLVNRAYGGKFDYTHGFDRIPKAMKKNLLQRLEDGKLRFTENY